MNEGGLRLKNISKTNISGDLITIVTVVFNGETFIEDTIKSVIGQNYLNIEYIVIDGGSTDKTLDVLRRYNDKIDYWRSEKDNGISDAFNKGINLAKGEIIGLVNADDYLNDNALQIVMNSYSREKPKVICGGMKITHPRRSAVTWYSTLDGIDKEMTIAHPATFIPKTIYNSCGLYDLQYKVAMDYEFILRVINKGVEFEFLRSILTTMRAGGVSSRQYWRVLIEITKARKKYLVHFSIVNAYLFIGLRYLQSSTMRLLDRIGIGKFVSSCFKRKVFRS
jgi:glycosyltransferase involved in cell wall biosynthesis